MSKASFQLAFYYPLSGSNLYDDHAQVMSSDISERGNANDFENRKGMLLRA